MSTTAHGIPINMGLTHGTISSSNYSLFCNAMPENFTLHYSKPMEFKNLDHLQEYTNDNIKTLIPGFCALIKNNDKNVFGTHNVQYIWNQNSWLKIGNTNIDEYLNIYDVSFMQDEEGFVTTFLSLFMHTHIKNIQSNVKLLSLLDMRYIIHNSEILTFAGLNGNYGINNNDSESLLHNLLFINLSSGISVLLRRLCEYYEAPIVKFTNFIGSCARSLEKVLDTTYYNFLKINDTNINVDLSMYINYIGACYASMKDVFKSIFNNNYKPVMIDPINSLMMIDKPLANRITMPGNLRNGYLELLQIIDDIIYRDYKLVAKEEDKEANREETEMERLERERKEIIKNILKKYYNVEVNDKENKETSKLNSDYFNFFNELYDLINFFKSNKEEIFTTQKSTNDFIDNLCEGIAGVITMALYLSIFSNCTAQSRTTLYFHFVVPTKYEEII